MFWWIIQSVHIDARVFGTLALFPLALNYLVQRKHYGPAAAAYQLSGMVMVVWAITSAMQVILPPPDAYKLNAALDLCCMWVAATVWSKFRYRFALILSWLYMVQICLDAAYQLAWMARPTPETTLLYMWPLNSIFLAQLACNSWPGVSHVGRSVGDWLRHHGGAHPDQGVRT